MNSKKPKILVVDNYDSFTFNLVQILDEHGGCSFDVRKNDAISLIQAAHYDGFIFSPGPGIPAEAPVMAELLRLFHRERSFLGICLGHQAIAETFGMRLAKLGTIRHGMRTRITIIDSSDYLFEGMPSAFEAGLYHSWAVTAEHDNSGVEPQLRVTALSGEGVIMSLAHVSYDLRGVQFHPESFISLESRAIVHNWMNHLVCRTRIAEPQ